VTINELAVAATNAICETFDGRDPAAATVRKPVWLGSAIVTLRATAFTAPGATAPVFPAMLAVTSGALPACAPVIPTPVRVSTSRVGVTATKSPPGLAGTVATGAALVAGVVVGTVLVVDAGLVVDATVDAGLVVDATVVSAPAVVDASLLRNATTAMAATRATPTTR